MLFQLCHPVQRKRDIPSLNVGFYKIEENPLLLQECFCLVGREASRVGLICDLWKKTLPRGFLEENGRYHVFSVHKANEERIESPVRRRKAVTRKRQ